MTKSMVSKLLFVAAAVAYSPKILELVGNAATLGAIKLTTPVLLILRLIPLA